jgi:ABC-type multidrug transport system fused ATPase/permease subunit
MKVLLRLTGYAWAHRVHLGGAYLTMSASTVSMMFVPYFLGTAIDEALANGSSDRLLLLAGGIMLVSVLRGLFSYGQTYLAETVSQKAAFDIRQDIFRKLQSLSFGFYDRQQTGNLMSKATADVDAVRMFISMGLIRGLTIFVTVGMVGGLMLATNWRLGLVSMAFVPIVMWRAVQMSRKLRPTWMKVQAETGNMTTVLQESLAGIRVVKAFGGRKYEEEKFEGTASSVAYLTYSATRLFASQGSFMTFVFTVAIGVILLIGGREVVDGRLTAGGLVTFILLMGLMQMPVRMTGWLVNTFTRASASGQRIFDVLDAVSPVTEKPGAPEMPLARGHVKFDHVSLSYDTAGTAIEDVDFEVLPGQLVAILGGPGSGKSTIVHAIPRFYDVTSGSVTIDGTDIRDVTLASLRANVGIVQQDVFVFAATIRDNIAYGVDEATHEQVVAAARVAQLHHFIDGLPDGYDTWVGERGITLSGGQRQRLAIARTVLLNPPILILDDSTSSVDVGTEYLIQQALAGVVHGRTTFVIAHRLSTVRSADLIIVLENGRVVERGTHEELLARDGFYRSIHDVQLMVQEEAPLDAAFQAAGGDA